MSDIKDGWVNPILTSNLASFLPGNETKAKLNKRRKSKATQSTQTNVQPLNLLGE
ncbi:MAG: hypothetical protein RH949_10875 [Coleofasciculus sp. A1-SPW-01]|uniref:hypothetical protein n=1 Tax=Coleofasciculus TaxID=669368 RepID=UPI0018DB04DD|nr:hypothetical protein [Coleofasciculus chthonoplastes]